MSPAMVLGLVVAGLVGVPALGVLGMWWEGLRLETRCRRGQHAWGRWEVILLRTPTVLGERNVQVSVCERGCGASVRRLTGADELWARDSELAEKLFREARS